MWRSLYFMCALAFSAEARAQAVSDPSTAPATTQPSIDQPSTTSALPNQTAAPAPGKFERYDDLSLKGWIIPFPKVEDTLVGDKGGVRDWLADRGVGVFGLALNTFQYNALQDNGGYNGKQLYNGQKNITRTSTGGILYLTYDLDHIGLHNGQISAVLTGLGSSFNEVNGPNIRRVTALNYFQTLFNDEIEIKVGINDNDYEFIGTNVGGSLTTGNLGPLATIPYEVGLSYGGFGAPTIDVRYNMGNYFYDKIGVQRSFPPGGAPAEFRINKSGFAFSPRGTGVLVINEFGYNRPSEVGEMSTWFRAGGIVNSTNYPNFRGKISNKNWALYALVDRQLTQIDRTKPYRGLYAGLSVNYAPPKQNLYSQYYEARLYGLGLLAPRPFDLASLVFTYTGYSKSALTALTQPEQRNYRQTISGVASYAYRLIPGLYLQPGVGFTVHPIYSPRFDTALNGYLSITTLF